MEPAKDVKSTGDTTSPEGSAELRRRNEKKVNEKDDGARDTTARPPSAVPEKAAGSERSTGHAKDAQREENGIARGVVLNANQFFSPKDIRWVSDKKINDKTKDLELAQNYIVQPGVEIFTSAKKQDIPADSEKTKMSLSRKFVFGLSFLPSILFVLCIAVIIPCEKHQDRKFCVKEMWSKTLRDSEFSADFDLSSSLMVGLSSDGLGNVISFNLETGEKNWNWLLKSAPRFIHCRGFDANGDGTEDCLLMDSSGELHAYNVSNGYTFWNATIGGSTSSLPVILPDCDEDGVNEIAVATSVSEITLVFNYKKTMRITLTDCKSLPTRMLPWPVQESMDLLFFCENENGSGEIHVLKQSSWCAKKNVDGPVQTFVSNSFSLDVDLSQALPVPMENNLLLWADQTVALISSNGSEIWRTSVASYPEKRFLLRGSFHHKQDEVALIGSSKENGTMVTLLRTMDGKETGEWHSPSIRTINAISVAAGEAEHYIVIAAEKEEIVRKSRNSSEVPVVAGGILSTEKPVASDMPYVLMEPFIHGVNWHLSLLRPRTGDKKAMDVNEIFSGIHDSSADLQDQLKFTGVVKGKDQSKNLVVYIGRPFSSYLNDSSVEYSTRLHALKAENLNNDETTSPCG